MKTKMKKQTKIREQSIPKTIDFLEMCRKQIRDHNFPGAQQIEKQFHIGHNTFNAAMIAGFFTRCPDGSYECQIPTTSAFTVRDAMDVLLNRAKYMNEKRIELLNRKKKLSNTLIDFTDDGFIGYFVTHELYHEMKRRGFNILIERKTITEL